VPEETVNVTDGIDLGRQAFERQVWGDAFRNLSAADIEHPLGLEDLERLAVAAYLVGRGEDSVEAGRERTKTALVTVTSRTLFVAHSGWHLDC
jgi:hypothetical protein